MPRRARIAVLGIPWHIIQRGNNRCACFCAEEGYRRYLETLQERATRHGCTIHAYMLKINQGIPQGPTLAPQGQVYFTLGKSVTD